jgi:trimethylamine--corrinoid protein Co-methyltransferase
MVRGIEVTDETLSVDLIDQVARGEGHFLGTQQSLELMNTEYFYPSIADRQARDDWETQGALDMWERARRRARDILASHTPKPIASTIDAEIRKRFEILLPSQTV